MKTGWLKRQEIFTCCAFAFLAVMAAPFAFAQEKLPAGFNTDLSERGT